MGGGGWRWGWEGEGGGWGMKVGVGGCCDHSIVLLHNSIIHVGFENEVIM